MLAGSTGPGFVRVDRTQHLFVLVPAPLGVLEVLRARLDLPARPCKSVFGSRTLADHGVNRSVLLIHQRRDVGQVGWQWWAFSPFPCDLSFHKLLKAYARVYHRTDHPLADTHHLPLFGLTRSDSPLSLWAEFVVGWCWGLLDVWAEGRQRA